MSIVEFNRPPSWSLDASGIGQSAKYPWAGVVESTSMLLTPPPLPTGVLYSTQFRSHQETKMAARRTQGSTYLRSHGKTGDYEQSTFMDCGYGFFSSHKYRMTLPHMISHLEMKYKLREIDKPVLLSMSSPQRAKTSKGSLPDENALARRLCLHCPSVVSLPWHSKSVNQITRLPLGLLLYVL